MARKKRTGKKCEGVSDRWCSAKRRKRGILFHWAPIEEDFVWFWPFPLVKAELRLWHKQASWATGKIGSLCPQEEGRRVVLIQSRKR